MNPFNTYNDALDRIGRAIHEGCDLALKSLRSMDASGPIGSTSAEASARTGKAPDAAPASAETTAPDPANLLDQRVNTAIAAHLGVDAEEARLPDVELPEKPTGLELSQDGSAS